MSADLNCPYCNAEIEICHDDGFGCQPEILHEYECPVCDKRFVFSVEWTINHYPQKADCLNDGKHDYQLTDTTPVEFSKMECAMCGKSRELTQSEREQFNIPSKQSYIDSLNQLSAK